VKRSPIRQIGRIGKRRAKGLKAAVPIVCERAGGYWNGYYCEHAHCELCRRTGYLETAHITSRAQGGDESPENLIALCCDCHELMDSADAETREKTRQRAREITRGKE